MGKEERDLQEDRARQVVEMLTSLGTYDAIGGHFA